MSNLSTEVFGDMNFLYEHIATKENEKLNENSEYYDEEFAELVENIISTISLSMVYEGYSAEGIISFLADFPEEDIIERYLNFDENILTESVVPEEYIQEQLVLLENKLKATWGLLKAAGKTLFSRGPGYAAPVKLAGPRAPGLLDKGKVLLSKGVGKVKDIARGAKAALTGSTAKKVGLGAAALGAATGAGYVGGKMSGAGSGQGSSPSIAKPTSKPTDDFLKGSSLAKLGGREGRVKGGEFRSINWTQQSRDRYNSANPPKPSTPPAASASSSGGAGTRAPSPAKPSAAKAKAPDKVPAGETPMQTWARTNPKLAANVRPGQSGYQEISQKRVVPSSYEKKDQTPTTGPEPTTAQKTQAGSDVAAYQAQERQNFEKKKKEVAALTQKESYDAYDLVIEYLLHTGHADTISEAEYVISNFDSDMIDTLIESTAMWIETL